jgi:hypothetical protein
MGAPLAPAMASVVPSDSFQNSQRSGEELLQKAIVNNEFVELEIGEVFRSRSQDACAFEPLANGRSLTPK